MSKKIIISKTGVINGRGSDRYKWVSYLTKKEREAVKNNQVVLIFDGNDHPGCTEYKQVYYHSGRFYHRNYYGEV